MSVNRRAAAFGLGVGLGGLLPRMRRDLEAGGVLRRSTAAGMWAAYLAAAGLYADAVRSGRPLAPLPRSAALALAAAGAGVAVAGMRRFASAGQVTGTAGGPLATGGVYRFSRNPQYVGAVLAGAAGAVAARSPGAAAVTAAYAAVLRWWVPVEERALAAGHGDAYRAYRARTARWVDRPRTGR